MTCWRSVTNQVLAVLASHTTDATRLRAQAKKMLPGDARKALEDIVEKIESGKDFDRQKTFAEFRLLCKNK